jgi:predicted ribosomally synthesized peptide with nif11-like leader
MQGSDSIELSSFCRQLDANPFLAQQVKDSNTPEQIVSIASLAGFQISTNELRKSSRELSAPYFPWSGKGHKFRREFFASLP